MTYSVIFQPSGNRGHVEPAQSLLEAAQKMGVELESLCGGAGSCGKCKVIIMEGNFPRYGVESSMAHLSPVTREEMGLLEQGELDEGYRLACLARVQGDLVVFVPPEVQRGKQVILEEGKKRQYRLLPAVESVTLKLERPTLQDNRADWERLSDSLADMNGYKPVIDFNVLQNLPENVRAGDFRAQADIWQAREVIRVTPAIKGRTTCFGLAVDVGTTTVAAYLCDLNSGEILEKASDVNSQVSYGEDVISRITFSTQKQENRRIMQRLIINTVNGLIEKMVEKAGGRVEDIIDATIVFNSVMHHLFLGLDPQNMGGSPFVPVSKESLDIKARDLGLGINGSAYVHTLPLVAGYVGADNVALLISEEPYRNEKMGLYIDIGTNGEVDLGNREGVSCTSCATGPALEGAQIAFGMRAAPGAIEKVAIDPDTLEPRYKIIGQETWYPERINTSARGICGSGIIDVVAEMYKSGILDSSGRFDRRMESPRLRQGDKGRMEYVLAWATETGLSRDVVIKQQDIRAVQLAKAALFVGADILLERKGVNLPEFIVLAGAFGSFINKESALTIGLFPPCSPENIFSVGNSAGDGALLALLDRDKREEAREVAQQVQFVETAADSTFQSRYIEALAFPQKI